MKNLTQLFETKKKNILSVFVTAGYPQLNSLESIVLDLESSGVDLIEVGIPFSDPMADGKTIQESSEIALKNGMNLTVLLAQLKSIRQKTTIPLVLMGYLNPVYQYGVERLLRFCKEYNIGGMIIPDISIQEYNRNYRLLFVKYGISLIFIATPNTSPERFAEIDKLSSSFIYLVSSASVTGSAGEFGKAHIKGFEYVRTQFLSTPILVGFGIHNNTTFKTVCEYFNGAIIGSAFIRYLSTSKNEISTFVKSIN